jgi:hypothetical protein
MDLKIGKHASTREKMQVTVDQSLHGDPWEGTTGAESWHRFLEGDEHLTAGDSGV